MRAVQTGEVVVGRTRVCLHVRETTSWSRFVSLVLCATIKIRRRSRYRSSEKLSGITSSHPTRHGVLLAEQKVPCLRASLARCGTCRVCLCRTALRSATHLAFRLTLQSECRLRSAAQIAPPAAFEKGAAKEQATRSTQQGTLRSGNEPFLWARKYSGGARNQQAKWNSHPPVLPLASCFLFHLVSCLS